MIGLGSILVSLVTVDITHESIQIAEALLANRIVVRVSSFPLRYTLCRVSHLAIDKCRHPFSVILLPSAFYQHVQRVGLCSLSRLALDRCRHPLSHTVAFYFLRFVLRSRYLKLIYCYSYRARVRASCATWSWRAAAPIVPDVVFVFIVYLVLMLIRKGWLSS